MNINKGFFITAIGTDSGKTLVSAIFTEALRADYWKPIQAGFPTDSDEVKRLLSNSESKILDERFLLRTPASPHAAAKVEEIEINLEDFEQPVSDKPLIVEGAGGLLVPINDNHVVANLIEKLKLPVILVSNLYLGNINHTLLSAHYLKQTGIEVAGLVFNGPENYESERIIEKMTGYRVLLKIPELPTINRETVKNYAYQLKNNLDGYR